MKRLRERRPAAVARKAAYNKAAWAATDKEKERERKRAWRAANREKLRAYYRNYEALTPGRREYKNKWQNENVYARQA